MSARRFRSAFCHVSWSVFEGVTKYQNCDSIPFPNMCQFATGTMPSGARSGANQLFVAMCPSASRTSGSALPKENTRRKFTAFVPN